MMAPMTAHYTCAFSILLFNVTFFSDASDGSFQNFAKQG